MKPETPINDRARILAWLDQCLELAGKMERGYKSMEATLPLPFAPAVLRAYRDEIERHQSNRDGEHCSRCGTAGSMRNAAPTWPCPTIKAGLSLLPEEVKA